MKQTLKTAALLAACATVVLACQPRKNAKDAGADDGSGVVSFGGKTCEVVDMIEDGENNDNQIVQSNGRNGYIYTFADKEGSTVEPQSGELGGTFAMTPGGANGSGYAAHMTGKVGTSSIVYVGVGFNLQDPKGQYDASKYDGISFLMRKGAEGTARVRLKVPDVNTDPEGGKCDQCFNDFGVDLKLKEEWTQYYVPFSAMKQMVGWGNPRPPAIEPKTIGSIQFQVADKGQSFDVWVDDLAFIKCQ
jgi:endoglucanase